MTGRYRKRSLVFGNEQCDYWLGRSEVTELANIISSVNASQYVIVCDTNVAELYGRSYARVLNANTPTMVLVHDANEVNKTLTTVEELGNEAIHQGADRGCAVIALGGGLTGNIAGLLSTLLYRGVTLVHVPTTLLAMLDSVFSLKQAVNSRLGKNSFGAYRLPEVIIADTGHVATLPPGETQAALFEVIKNALSIVPHRIDWLSTTLRHSAVYTNHELSALIDFAIESKQVVMADDRFEKSIALVCEYGHTVGHAIEHSGYATHGHAIGIGMLVAGEVSFQRGELSDEELSTHYDLVDQNGGIRGALERVDDDVVLEALQFDNKKGLLSLEDDEVVMVLLRKLGRPNVTPSGTPLTAVDRRELRVALMRTRERVLT